MKLEMAYLEGDHVRAIFPEKWGEGVITKIRLNPDLKPFVVLNDDDGTLGYFHADQIETLSNL